MDRWLIAIIRPDKLTTALRGLNEINCEAWFPLMTRHRRIGNVEVNALETYLLIVLPNDRNEYEIEDVRGVTKLARDADGNPGYATNEEVEAMKDYQAKPPEMPAQPFSVGDRVKVRDGPLIGFTGAVCALKRQNAVRVDMDAGKTLNLPADLLEVIDG